MTDGGDFPSAPAKRQVFPKARVPGDIPQPTAPAVG
jgi:hypothetical protein